MMRRWHHGHSLGAGVLVGLLISRRPEVIFAAGFLSALLAIGVFSAARHLIYWLADRRRVPPDYVMEYRRR